MTGGWTRKRVVVEVPVRGELTEKDLRWWVEQAVNDLNSTRERGLRARHPGIQLGKIEVKSLTKMEGAAKRLGQRASQRLIAAEQAVSALEKRVRNLERDTNPHRFSPGSTRDD